MTQEFLTGRAKAAVGSRGQMRAEPMAPRRLALLAVLGVGLALSGGPAMAETEVGEQKPSARGKLPKAQPLPGPERREAGPENKARPDAEGPPPDGCPYRKRPLELIV